jgi:hypothetical protein
VSLAIVSAMCVPASLGGRVLRPLRRGNSTD